MEPEPLPLIGDWEAGGEMELDNVYRPETYRWEPGQLRNHRTPGQRTNQFVVVCLLVLSVEVLVGLLVVVYGRPCRASPDSQAAVQPDSSSMGKQQQVSSAPGDDGETPRAMLTAPHTNSSTSPHLQWESIMGTAFCKGGFNYSDGHLVVPRAGYYSVFLQITYEGCHDDDDTDCEMLILSQSVYYIHDSHPQYKLLLSAVDSVMCTQGWRKSLYTSGLFLLEENSRLKVESKHYKCITSNEDQVFFGAKLHPDSG